MMRPVLRIDGSGASPVEGSPEIDIQKILWNGFMIAGAVILAPLTFTWPAVFMFFLLTYFTLLVGHSAGMHRMMIHRTYRVPKWLERTLIYIGVLVGMAGPFGILRIHDLRDWAQRQPHCHDFFSHRRGFFRDVSWQLTSKFRFAKPPKFFIEDDLYKDQWYQFLEKTWSGHQLLMAVPLYAMGGWPWVVWGIFVRVSVSILGHWTITYFCHNPGPGKWRVAKAGVQASNLPGIGILTYGECWHNNHHAFPESARIGLERGQSDPAWWFISFLGRLGLATDIGLPRSKEEQDDIYLAASAEYPIAPEPCPDYFKQ